MGHRGNGSRGASLLEVMVALAIMAIIGTGLIVSTAGGRARASTVSVAEQLAQLFTQARESAIAQQRPFAVIVPSTPTLALSNSCYLADGAERAVVRSTVNYGSEFPGTYLFVGHWPLSAGSNAPPSPLTSANQGGFQWPPWNVPDPSHAVYVYTAAGTLQSNQVEFDQAYHIIVCESAQWSATTVAETPSALLAAVSAPMTLVLSKTGQVNIVPQVPGQSGLSIDQLPPYTGPVNLSRSAAPTVAGTPIVQHVDVDPKPENDTLPPDIDATVVPDGYLSLKVSASDPEGDPLSISWSAKDANNASKSGGVFSSPLPEEIEYKSGTHVSTWEWKPPADSLPGDRFILTAKVSDGANSATAHVGAEGRVLVIDPGTILFADNRNGNREIYKMNNDGTGEVRLTDTPQDEAWPQLSPNGQRIMYVRKQGGTQVLMTMGINGENPTQVLGPADTPAHFPSMAPHDSIVSCCWSPDGTQIAVVARYGGPTGGHDVYVCSANGTGPMTKPYNDPIGGLSVTDAPKVTWSFDAPYRPDNLSTQRLLYTSPYDGRYFAFHLNGDPEQPYSHTVYDINAGPSGKVSWVEGGNLHVGSFSAAGGLVSEAGVSGGLANPKAPSWSPTGESLVFSAGSPPSLYRVEKNGSGRAKLTTPGTALEASWGP